MIDISKHFYLGLNFYLVSFYCFIVRLIKFLKRSIIVLVSILFVTESRNANLCNKTKIIYINFKIRSKFVVKDKKINLALLSSFYLFIFI